MNQNTENTQQVDPQKKLNQQLIDMSVQHNVVRIKQLLQQGADPNYIRYTDSNCWYSGNTHTALYSAVHSNFTDQQAYNETIDILLKNKANPNFKATRGGWNHCEQYPLFNGVISALAKFTNTQNKIKLIQMFVKAGININQSENHGRSKNWRAYRSNTNFIFKMMDMNGMGSKLRDLEKSQQIQNIHQNKQLEYKQLKKQFNKQFNIEEEKQEKQAEEQGNQNQNKQQQEQQQQKQKKKAPQINLIQALINFGANVNSSRSYHYWANQNSDRYDQDCSEQDVIQNQYETILHRAIMHNSVALVKLLLEKGADANKQCTFSVSFPYYPKDWSEKLKERKINDNLKNLKYAEEQKQQLKKETNDWKQLEGYEFQIFCAKKYKVENDAPIIKYKDIQLSPLQIAEKLKVDQQIINLLKNWKPNPKSQNQLKKQAKNYREQEYD